LRLLRVFRSLSKEQVNPVNPVRQVFFKNLWCNLIL
jgi:hypothetical protein